MRNKNGGCCTYCGDYADQRDHVIPISYNYVCRKQAKTSRKNTVPACAACNQTLSDRADFSIYKRATYLRDQLKAKMAKHTSVWLPHELTQCEGKVLADAKAGNAKAKQNDYRLEHMKHIAKSRASIDMAWEAYDQGITLVTYLNCTPSRKEMQLEIDRLKALVKLYLDG